MLVIVHVKAFPRFEAQSSLAFCGDTSVPFTCRESALCDTDTDNDNLSRDIQPSKPQLQRIYKTILSP